MFYLFQPVDFEWDDQKAASNEAKHGVSFRFALRVFGDPGRIQEADDRKDYGEPRWRVLGHIDGDLFHVTVTFRAGAVRLISARRAHRKERQTYGDRQNFR